VHRLPRKALKPLTISVPVDAADYDCRSPQARLRSGQRRARCLLRPRRLAPRTPTDTLATYIPKLAAVPLDFQPGTLWRYSGQAGFDVLSRVVEVVSGQTFDAFLKQRLFDPLGMKDTGFFPAGRQGITTGHDLSTDAARSATGQSRLSRTCYFLGRRWP
jgi:CubicO group peptidase (beta-lactamase class C family)